jgi:hypothetical protein
MALMVYRCIGVYCYVMLHLTPCHRSKWDSFDILLVLVFALLGVAFLLWFILYGRSDGLLYAGLFLAACAGLLIARLETGKYI